MEKTAAPMKNPAKVVALGLRADSLPPHNYPSASANIKIVMMLPHTERLPPKYGERIRAPSISTVMMQKPLANAIAATMVRGTVGKELSLTIVCQPTVGGFR